MSILQRIAFFQDRKDEVPNQVLARLLTTERDEHGIKEIADNLFNRNPLIQGDCIKVMYEVGYLAPELISDYYRDFIRLLSNRENRLVWGGMLALSTVAQLKAEELHEFVPLIEKTMRAGSVITIDAGVKTLAQIAAAKPAYSDEIVPYLLDHLRKCRTKEVPQHAESTFPAITEEYRQAYRLVLEDRLEAMTPPQSKRIHRLLKQLDN